MNNYTTLIQNYIAHSNEKEIIKQNLTTLFEHKTYEKLLDIGCGTGEILPTILPFFNSITAIDQEFRLNQSVANNPKISFVKQNFLEFQTPIRFDIILASYVLWEIPYKDWKNFFEKIKSLLTPKGFLIVVDEYSKAGVDKLFFNMDTHLTKSSLTPDWYDYLNAKNIKHEKHPFFSQIKTKTASEMYDVLKFFFQGAKKEKFYTIHKPEIMKIIKNKKITDRYIIKMQHTLDILYL